jgi:UDP-N-acetylmuramoyl-tripeptide--D-alanyl-D-alanine ligase
MIALTLAEIASAVGGTLQLDGTDAAADTVVAGARHDRLA